MAEITGLDECLAHVPSGKLAEAKRLLYGKELE